MWNFLKKIFIPQFAQMQKKTRDINLKTRIVFAFSNVVCHFELLILPEIL